MYVNALAHLTISGTPIGMMPIAVCDLLSDMLCGRTTVSISHNSVRDAHAIREYCICVSVEVRFCMDRSDWAFHDRTWCSKMYYLTLHGDTTPIAMRTSVNAAFALAIAVGRH
jgi:hypothetical protein